MKKLLGILPFLVLVSCGDKHLAVDRQKKAGAAAQSSPKVPGSVAPAVTFTKDIQPIFKRACIACHNEGSAIPNWSNYEISFAKKDRLLDRVVIKRDMPLGMPMSDEERALVAEWLKLGAPLGGSEDVAKAEPIPESAPAPAPAPPTPVPPVDEPQVVTYSQVKTAVFQQYCNLCHNENSPEMMPNWLSYSVASGRKDRLYVRVVKEKNMPPEGMPFSEEARSLLEKWVDGGAVE